MLDYLDTAGCRMAFLRRQLDDPSAPTPCGRCDNCTGTVWNTRGRRRPMPTAAGERLARPGVEVAPRQAVAQRAWTSSGSRSPGGSRPTSRPSRAGDRAAVRHRLGHPAARAAWRGADHDGDAARAPTSRCRRTCSTPACGCWRAGAGRSGRSAWSASGRAPGPTSSPTWPGGSPRSAGCRCCGTLPPAGARPGSARQLGPAARRRVGRGSREPRLHRARRPGAARRRRDRHRLDDHGGRPAACAGRERRPCCRSPWPRRADRCVGSQDPHARPLSSAREQVLQHLAVVVASLPRRSRPTASGVAT